MPKYNTVNIHDHGRPIYLNGSTMQYTIWSGAEVIAYCDDFEVARAIAHAICDGEIIILGRD